MLLCSILIECCPIILQRENEVKNHSVNPDKHLNEESEIQISQKAEMDTLENLRSYGNRAFPSVLTLAVPDAIQEDEIAITLENQENLPEGNVLNYSLGILVWKGTRVSVLGGKKGNTIPENAIEISFHFVLKLQVFWAIVSQPQVWWLI